jgi:hypothetical protein
MPTSGVAAWGSGAAKGRREMVMISRALIWFPTGDMVHCQLPVQLSPSGRPARRRTRRPPPVAAPEGRRSPRP